VLPPWQLHRYTVGSTPWSYGARRRRPTHVREDSRENATALFWSKRPDGVTADSGHRTADRITMAAHRLVGTPANVDSGQYGHALYAMTKSGAVCLGSPAHRQIRPLTNGIRAFFEHRTPSTTANLERNLETRRQCCEDLVRSLAERRLAGGCYACRRGQSPALPSPKRPEDLFWPRAKGLMRRHTGCGDLRRLLAAEAVQKGEIRASG